MTWTRLSDDFTDRPSLLGLSRSARLLHVEALVYCNRHLTDGALPQAALARISDSANVERDAAELEAAGVWRRVDLAHWQIDWTDQEEAASVRKRRERVAEKQKRYRDRQRSALPGNATGNGRRNATGLVTPSRPVPQTGQAQRCANGHLISADGGCCPDHDSASVTL